MDCTAYREIISARMDGEEHAVEARAVDAHLTICEPCRSWADAAAAVTRATRVGLADAVPDLTDPILAATSRSARGRPGYGTGRAAGPGASPATVARLGLLMVAIAQVALAVPALLGSDPGASIHVAHEQGSWALALAVGLLVVALRPPRAGALLPVVGALAGGLSLTMILDIAAGRTTAAAEAPHGLAFLGLGLLWLLTRAVRPAGHGRASNLPRVA